MLKIIRILPSFLLTLLVLLPGKLPATDLPGSIVTSGEDRFLRFEFPDRSAESRGDLQQTLKLTYTSRHQGYADTEIRIRAGGQIASVTLIPRFGTHQVYLYPYLLGFPPKTLDIRLSEDLEVIALSLEEEIDQISPLPADIGTILTFPAEHWRRADYELFSWNLAPSVLIYVTADYEQQSRLFKRLAFFVEKPGFSGRLHTNAAIEDRHGWNAHDYRAEDLARFFRTAEQEKFELNPEEYELLDVLLANSICLRIGGTIQPGSGSVLSISLETPPALREKFLIHEAFHGLFFTSPRFRTACLDCWRQLSDDEQWFWKRFFTYRTYNVENEFLLVNEYMAYLMQQKESDLDDYYKDFIYNQLITALPEERPTIETFFNNYPDTFRLSSARIEKAAETLFGVRAGDLACLIYHP